MLNWRNVIKIQISAEVTNCLIIFRLCQKRLAKEFLKKWSNSNPIKKKNLQRKKMSQFPFSQNHKRKLMTEKIVRNLSIFIQIQAKKILKSNRRKSPKFHALSKIRLFQRNLSLSISFLLIFQKALTKLNSLLSLMKWRATINWRLPNSVSRRSIQKWIFLREEKFFLSKCSKNPYYWKAMKENNAPIQDTKLRRSLQKRFEIF
jgi:hypothetical protein